MHLGLLDMDAENLLVQVLIHIYVLHSLFLAQVS